MTTNHLLSASLFAELFQHNMVSPDGLIIASEKQLEDYYSFLVQRSKDKVKDLYIERRNMVKDAEKLLKKDFLTEEQEKLLQKLLEELDLKYEEDDEVLHLKEPKKPRRMYLGPKEPKKSLFEREIDEELYRVQILKRDLRTLDDWLDELSIFRPSFAQNDRDDAEWKEAGKKFRQRTKNRMHDMENARSKIIKQYYEDYDNMLKSVLSHKKKTLKESKNAVGHRGKAPGRSDEVEATTTRPSVAQPSKEKAKDVKEKNGTTLKEEAILEDKVPKETIEDNLKDGTVDDNVTD